MLTAANHARRYNSRYGIVVSLLALAWVALSPVLSTPTRVLAEDRRLDYLNEAMRVPNSSKFREGDFINSGVGLRFGSYCQKLWIWRDRATKAIDGIKGESVSSG